MSKAKSSNVANQFSTNFNKQDIFNLFCQKFSDKHERNIVTADAMTRMMAETTAAYKEQRINKDERNTLLNSIYTADYSFLSIAEQKVAQEKHSELKKQISKHLYEEAILSGEPLPEFLENCQNEMETTVQYVYTTIKNNEQNTASDTQTIAGTFSYAMNEQRNIAKDLDVVKTDDESAAYAAFLDEKTILIKLAIEAAKNATPKDPVAKDLQTKLQQHLKF